MTKAEWEQVRNNITYNFVNDNHFEELKEGEIMAERLRILGEVDPLVGKYFSLAWVRKNVLRMTEEEIDTMQREIDLESEENPEEDISIEEPQEEEVFPEYKPEKDLTEEEKRLVESMTKFYDSFSSQEDIDNGSS